MLETQNKSDTPNFEPVRVKQQVIICSSFPTLCLASWIETQVFLNPIGLRPPMGRQLVMVLSFSERLKVKILSLHSAKSIVTQNTTVNLFQL